MVVFGPGKNFLFKSMLGRCGTNENTSLQIFHVLPKSEGFQTMVILDLYGMSFHAVVILALIKKFAQHTLMNRLDCPIFSINSK